MDGLEEVGLEQMENEMRIHELHIYTQNLEQQVAFYSETLDLILLKKTSEIAQFQVGSSILTLELAEESTPYHFAINIPSNQEGEALQWLQKRVSVIMDEDNSIHDFDFWNAKAIYFYDCDKNIVEFIARKNLNHQSKTAFSAAALLEISEIGAPVRKLQQTYDALYELCGIGIYDGGYERFLAVGDERGLFICINKGRKNWFPAGDTSFSSPFTIHFEENGQQHRIQFKNESFTKVSEKIGEGVI